MKRSIPLAILAGALIAGIALPIGAAPLNPNSTAAATGDSLVIKVQSKKKKGNDVGACRDTVVETGAQWPFEGMARNSARNDWIQKVRFMHGELFIDIAKAKNVKYRCTPTGVLGLIRCEVSARPCREL
jgi:hypothetical protein